MTPEEILKRPYARVLVPQEDGSWMAYILEFPGCLTVGYTSAQALSSLGEVAVSWLEATLAMGRSVPEPLEFAAWPRAREAGWP